MEAANEEDDASKEVEDLALKEGRMKAPSEEEDAPKKGEVAATAGVRMEAANEEEDISKRCVVAIQKEGRMEAINNKNVVTRKEEAVCGETGTMVTMTGIMSVETKEGGIQSQSMDMIQTVAQETQIKLRSNDKNVAEAENEATIPALHADELEAMMIAEEREAEIPHNNEAAALVENNALIQSLLAEESIPQEEIEAMMMHARPREAQIISENKVTVQADIISLIQTTKRETEGEIEEEIEEEMEVKRQGDIEAIVEDPRWIQGKIQQLTIHNIDQETKEILQILDEAVIFDLAEGSSNFRILVEKFEDLYEQPSFTQLLKEVHSYSQRRKLLKKEESFGIIWQLFESLWITCGLTAKKCIAKLKIFLPLDPGFSTWFLQKLVERCDSRERNVHFIDVVTFLIREGADPFQPMEGMISFTLFLEKFCSYLNDSLTSSVNAFLEEVWKFDCNLNDVIKAVPKSIIEGYSRHSSSVKSLIFGNCLKMIETDHEHCDQVGDEGRTPLHNLMEKLMIDGFWKRIPDFVAGTDSLWNLISELITEKNVNIRDKDQVTPYSWFFLWLESVRLHDAQYQQKMARKIKDLKECFQTNGANEEDAILCMDALQEREMEGLLERLLGFLQHMSYQLRFEGRSIKEIIAGVEMDVERIKHLKSKGCGKCITRLTRTVKFKELAQRHMEIHNDRLLGITEGILKVMIVESNAQYIYGILMKQAMHKFNHDALFEVLRSCLENGAVPTIDEIHEISLLTVAECSSYESLLATARIMEQLIGAYRNRGKKEPVKIYLNPIQDQWKIMKDLRVATRSVIRAAYGTLTNCIESKSVINILLHLRRENSDDDIKKSFDEADALLQKDLRDPPVTQWVKEKGHRFDKYSQEGKTAIKKQKTDLRWAMVQRNDNWLRRNVLHLAAILCHDEKVLNCIPDELIERQIGEEDLHGCTPLHIAHLHGNLSAIKLLESHNAKLCADQFGKFPECPNEDPEADFKKYCGQILKVKSSVFENMKKKFVLPVDEGIAIKRDLKELFTRMVGNDGFLNAEIYMGGSVREKQKVGNWNEFDLQLCTKIRPYGKKVRKRYEDEPFACLKIHEYLVKRLAEVDKSGIYLRCVSIGNPWKFVWEGEDCCKGLKISVDVVPIFVKDNTLRKQDRQGYIVGDALGHQELVHLKWKVLETEPDWNETICRHEWDILHNLAPGCRLGILISKLLLEVMDQTRAIHLLKIAITTYDIKNTLLWLLSGRTPREIEDDHGNVIGERYGALHQQLQFTSHDPKWMTEEDVEKYAEEGRFWAEKIFDVIQFAARKYRKTELGSFVARQSHTLNVKNDLRLDYIQHLDILDGLLSAHEVIDVLDICGRCLEMLKPDVFFTEEVCSSSDKEGDAAIRTKLQKVIDRFYGKAETVPGVRLWKRRREAERLIIRIDELKYDRDNERFWELKEEIDLLLREHAGEAQFPLLMEKERACEVMDEEIDKFLQELGHANNKESVLFRLRGEIKELERSVGLMGQSHVGGRNAAITRKKENCTQLEQKVMELRHGKISYLDRLEKLVHNISQNDPTTYDNFQAAITKQLGYTSCWDTEEDEATSQRRRPCIGNEYLPDNHRYSSSNNPQCEIAELPGYDPNDVLRGVELDITTMDKYALLCGLPAPSTLYLQAMSPDPASAPVAAGESFTAIHYINNHYVVSCLRNGRIVLYDSLYDVQRIHQILPQLKSLYQLGIDTSDIEYLTPHPQGVCSDCGLFAAANATMLIHGIDPCDVTLDTLLLRVHMHSCLQNAEIRLFPTL